MGNKPSVAPLDTSTFVYEQQDLFVREEAVAYKFLTWESTPQHIKQKMMDAVRLQLPADIEQVPYIRFLGFHHIIRKVGWTEWGLCVSNHHAVLAVLREMKPKRPFTIHYSNPYWKVSFIHDFSNPTASSDPT